MLTASRVVERRFVVLEIGTLDWAVMLGLIVALPAVDLHWAYGLTDAVPEIQTSLSLVVIVVVLVLTTVVSLFKSR